MVALSKRDFGFQALSRVWKINPSIISDARKEIDI